MDDDEPRHGTGRPPDDPSAAASDPGVPGAEGGERSDPAPVPFAPDQGDDSAWGDTDQHSNA